MLTIILSILGLLIGFFVWSAFLGTPFATLPVKLKAKKLGLIESINPLMIIGQFMISVVIILLMLIFAPVMFYSSLIPLIITLFNIPKLRREAIENLTQEYDGIDISRMT